MRLNFQVQGEGFPLIILHGFLGSSDNWRVASKRLGERYKVYSIDLRNHGCSPHSDIMNYAVMSQDVCDFMDDRGFSSSFVLGHSMGGKVAMQFATEFPNRVEKLIVVDIAPKAYPASHRPILSALSTLELKAYKSFGEVDGALAAAIPEASLRQFLLKNLTRDKDGGLSWKIDLEAIARNYDNLAAAIAPRQSFNRPACFIRGGQSNYIRDDDISLIQKTFPRAEIKTIPNAGHWVHADAPEEFLEIVTDFLSRN
jgi:esterase